MKRNMILEQMALLQEEIERLFERLFGYRPHDAEAEDIILFPETDVYETEDHVVLLFEIPGVKVEKLRVYTTGNTVIVEGFKTNEKLDPSANFRYLRAERHFGRFRRVVEVPTPCNMRDAKAILKNGVLKVKLQKIQERRRPVYNIPIISEESE